MLYFTYSLDVLLLLAIPIALGIILTRKLELEGRWWWIGAGAYILSQLLLYPLENYLLNPFLNKFSSSGSLPSLQVLILGGLSLGLLAALFEELIRYGTFRWWAKDARTYASGLLLGTGAGGAASIFLGLLVAYNFINMSMVRNSDISQLVSPDQVQYVQSQITAFWSAPWYYTLREAAAQFFNLIIEICLAVTVLQVFIRKQIYWLYIAIGFHVVVETTNVITVNLSGETLTNAFLGLFALISVFGILLLRNYQPVGEPSPEIVEQTVKED